VLAWARSEKKKNGKERNRTANATASRWKRGLVFYIQLCDPINFIYFIGHYIKSEKENEKVLAIFQWETLVKPVSLYFGKCNFSGNYLI